MDNYLALIRKADLLDLYRYGVLHVNRDTVCQFTCKVEELKERQIFLNNISAFSNSFDSSFSYLFIYYVKGGCPSRINDVRIEEVQGIFPLDYEGKRNLEMIDDKIIINDPIWPDAAVLLQKHQMEMSCKQGALNVWRVFGIESPIAKYESVVTQNVINDTIQGLFDDQRPSGNQHPLVYLLRYERHSYYPKNTIGFFMDAVNVIFNIMGGKEVEEDQISSSMICRYLSYLHQSNPMMKYDEICYQIEQEARVQAIVNKSKELLPGFDFMKVAVLYLTFKNKSQDGLFFDTAWVDFGKTQGENFYLACYLLGVSLSHEHTSDCLYEVVGLPILKKKTVKPQVEELEKRSDNPEPSDVGQSSENDKENLCDQKDAGLANEYPKKMALIATKGKNKGKPKQNTKVLSVNNKQEEENLIRKGYSIYVEG